jgi:uncharacterized protein
VQLAIISDTHLPRGARRLPDGCVARLRVADVIIHAGDFVALPVLEELRSLGEVVGVAGNVDHEDVRSQLPASTVVRAGSVQIGLVHDAGQARGRLARLRARFPHADAVVFGHSHLPLHERAPGGFQIFNPGSPTERRRAPRPTMGVASVDADRIRFEIVELN